MNEKRIKIPLIIDDPIVGRVLSLPAPFMHDHIIVEEGVLSIKHSKLSIKPPQSYNIKEISKLVVIKKEMTGWNKELKFDPYAPAGSHFSLCLMDKNDKMIELIPWFLLGHAYGESEWNHFLNKLSEYSGLQIEEINET